MADVDVLVLHGSPGAGKSTLARAISEALREADEPHAILDPDELNLVYPSQGRSFAMNNLRVLWPIYAAIPGVARILIPSVIADESELAALKGAAPAPRFMVCELTAPKDVLMARVTAREPNAFWQERLRGFVELHHQRTDLQRIRNFQVSTHGRSIGDAANEVIDKAGWRTN